VSTATRLAARIGILALFGGWAFPLYWMVLSSVTPEARLFGAPSLLPFSPVADHYVALFAERRFWLPIRNSLLVAGATTVLAVAAAVPAAYALARLRFRGRAALLPAILAVSVFPQISVVSPLFLILRAAGLLDTFPGLVLPYLTFALPLAVWLMTAFFRQLPRELEESALMDGASRLRTIIEILLPISAPAVGATAILTFLYAWNEFLFALSFTLGPERQTVPVAIALFRGHYQVPWGQVLAAAVVASVPVAVVVFAFGRRMVSGLTAGAVKG
jgi:ABC-type glycerol-3-phosphate transport system permease component